MKEIKLHPSIPKGHQHVHQVVCWKTYRVPLFPGEGYQQLLRVLQVKEAERLKQQSQKERLQERLSRAQEEISALQNSMAQRASHYQNLHTELLERGSQATDSQKEVTMLSHRYSSGLWSETKDDQRYKSEQHIYRTWCHSF